MREKVAAREKENIFSNGLIFPAQIFFSIFHDRLNLHLVKTGLKERKKEGKKVGPPNWTQSGGIRKKWEHKRLENLQTYFGKIIWWWTMRWTKSFCILKECGRKEEEEVYRMDGRIKFYKLINKSFVKLYYLLPLDSSFDECPQRPNLWTWLRFINWTLAPQQGTFLVICDSKSECISVSILNYLFSHKLSRH